MVTGIYFKKINILNIREPALTEVKVRKLSSFGWKQNLEVELPVHIKNQR